MLTQATPPTVIWTRRAVSGLGPWFLARFIGNSIIIYCLVLDGNLTTRLVLVFLCKFRCILKLLFVVRWLNDHIVERILTWYLQSSCLEFAAARVSLDHTWTVLWNGFEIAFWLVLARQCLCRITDLAAGRSFLIFHLQKSLLFLLQELNAFIEIFKLTIGLVKVVGARDRSCCLLFASVVISGGGERLRLFLRDGVTALSFAFLAARWLLLLGPSHYCDLLLDIGLGHILLRGFPLTTYLVGIKRLWFSHRPLLLLRLSRLHATARILNSSRCNSHFCSGWGACLRKITLGGSPIENVVSIELQGWLSMSWFTWLDLFSLLFFVEHKLSDGGPLVFVPLKVFSFGPVVVCPHFFSN